MSEFDATIRRNPPGDATVRRNPDVKDQTIRRSEEDPSLTVRRVPEPQVLSEPKPDTLPAFRGSADGRQKRYEVIRPLASGGEGNLYLCEADGRQLVVKVLRHDSDLEVLEALVKAREALADSHLIPLEYMGSMQDLGGQVPDTRRWLVMPYYARGDLSRLTNMRRLNPSISFNGNEYEFLGTNADHARVSCDWAAVDEKAFEVLVRQLHTAIKTLHEAPILPGSGGIVHRDIRPQNILLDADGNYVLGDFGLVSMLQQGLKMKFTRRFGVSHGYSPPEAYSGASIKQSVTRKYDYFSLGMTLLHILGGRPRFLLEEENENLAPYETTLSDFYETIALSNVPIPEALPARIRSLLQGLLLASADHRWGAAEVEAWLGGENPFVHAASAERDSGISVKINRRLYQGDADVIHAILDNWDVFRGLVDQKMLEFSWSEPDLAVRARVEGAVSRSRFMAPELGLREIIRSIDPFIGHVFFGQHFESDVALGEAMLAADEPGLFGEYLATGGLSTMKRAAGTSDPSQIQLIESIEHQAELQPLNAVHLMGAFLAKRALPPLTVILPNGDEHSYTLEKLTQELKNLFSQMVSDYIRETELLMPHLTPIPGLYAREGTTSVVQYDGSVIGDPSIWQVQMRAPEKLRVLAQWMSGGHALRTVTGLNPVLFLHMYACGLISPGVRSAADSPAQGFTADPQQIAELLGIFPEFRLQHGLDEICTRYCEHMRSNLDQVAGVRLPRIKGAGLSRIDADRRAAKDAIQEFLETKRYGDLIRVMTIVPKVQESIGQNAEMNHRAAVRLNIAFEQVFAEKDRHLAGRFDALMAHYTHSLDDPESLLKLSRELEALQGAAAQRRRENIQRYALAPEMEYLRVVSQEDPAGVDFVLPDTTNADEYFAAVQRWARTRARKHRRRK